MKKALLPALLGLLACTLPARAVIIDWTDVNGALAGTPTLSPGNLSFTDVNGIIGLNLIITIAASSQGGPLNLDAANPSPFLSTSVDNLRAFSGVSGNALTFTFNQAVSFVLDSAQHGFFGASEELRVSSAASMTGSLIGTVGAQTITAGSATTITALGNGDLNAGAVWVVSSGANTATSFTVDYMRRNPLEGTGFEPFRVDIAAAGVPDAGSTVALLGLGLTALAGLRRKFSAGPPA